jgi:CheY-like chemotaxis protein
MTDDRLKELQDLGPLPYIVLVIDDAFGEVEGLLSALSDSGIQAMYAASGAQGLEMAREMLPDLILCDLRMPNMTGWEVLEALNLDAALRDIFIVMLDEEWAMDPNAFNAWSKRTPSGRTADVHWTKPIDVEICTECTLNLLSRVGGRRRGC